MRRAPKSDLVGLSAAGIHGLALQALLPPVRLSLSEYSERHRWLDNQGGGYVGRWRNSEVPYLIEPMDCLDSLEFLTVAVSGPGQSGKTSGGENWLLKCVDTNPANMLWYMQTDDGIEAYVKNRIDPMVDRHAALSSKIGHRSSDDSIHYKRFAGMSVEFLSATARNLINKSAPRIIADEIDAYPDSLGDPKALLDVRRQTFGAESMLFIASHPDKATGLVPSKDWNAGVMAVYADSDRRKWYWPCPHCDAFSSPVPTAARYMSLEFETDDEIDLDQVEASAHLLCPVNGCVIEDKYRRSMNSRGVWVGLGQEISQTGSITGQLVKRKTAGFWIVGVMSPFIIGGIGGLARAYVKAKREFEISGDEVSLKQVMTKQFGIPYSRPRSAGSVDAETLAERSLAETCVLGQVADGVRFLVCAVDVQRGYFEYLVRGFGERGESWIVDKGRIVGEPGTSSESWDELLNLFAKIYPLQSDPGRGMTIKACGFDSGGEPGVSLQAYAAWRRWKKRKLIRSIGKIGGRDVYSIIPTKGASGKNAAKLTVTYPDTQRKANVAAAAGTVPLALFNPNNFKEDLFGQLQNGDSGTDFFVHFPRQLRSKESPHVWFEQCVAEHQVKGGDWERITPSSRNEALDLMVMSHVIAHLHGLPRIKWEAPPAWAARWEHNSGIVALEIKGDQVVKADKQPNAAPKPSLAKRLA